MSRDAPLAVGALEGTVIGALFRVSLTVVVVFSMVAELAAVPFMLMVRSWTMHQG